MPVLAPLLLWSGAVLLHARAHRAGAVVATMGAVFALLSASGGGAGVGAAVIHLTAALTMIAVLHPLVSKPVVARLSVVGLGLLIGVVELLT